MSGSIGRFTFPSPSIRQPCAKHSPPIEGVAGVSHPWRFLCTLEGWHEGPCRGERVDEASWMRTLVVWQGEDWALEQVDFVPGAPVADALVEVHYELLARRLTKEKKR